MKPRHIALLILFISIPQSWASSLQKEIQKTDQLKKPMMIERAHLASTFSKFKECLAVKEQLKTIHGLSKEKKLELKKREFALCKK